MILQLRTDRLIEFEHHVYRVISSDGKTVKLLLREGMMAFVYKPLADILERGVEEKPEADKVPF